jgi:hypothetical protein
MSKETTVTGPEPEPVVAVTGIDELFDGDPNAGSPPDHPDAASADDDSLDDEFDLPAARGRLPRLTALLLAGVLIATGFLAGAYVQRTHGASSPATAGFPNFGSGGPPNFGGALPGGDTSTQGGSSTNNRNNVIGTVVRAGAHSIMVKDFGGTTHVVQIRASTQVSKNQQIDASALKPGATVVVSGQSGADGSITATNITQR